MLRSAHLALGALALLLAGPVAAEEAPQPLDAAVVAIIDYQRVLTDSLAAQSIRRQVEDLRLRFEEEIGEERSRLEALDRALNQRRSELGSDDYRDQRRAFEADVATVQRLVQERRRQLDSASANAFQLVRDEIIQVINDLGDLYAFNVVLPRSDVLVFAPEIDLTSQVMAALDERLPDVPIPLDEN